MGGPHSHQAPGVDPSRALDQSRSVQVAKTIKEVIEYRIESPPKL